MLQLLCKYQVHFVKDVLTDLSIVFTPQPLRAVRVLFSPMATGWVGGRKILFDLDLTFDLAGVILSLKILSSLYLRYCKV